MSALLTMTMIFIHGCDPQDTVASTPDKVLNKTFIAYNDALEVMNDTNRSPRSLEDGEIRYTSASKWTSGFFPGILWMLYEFTGEDALKQEADHYTMNLEKEKLNGRTHDMGFKMYCSFGNGYRLTGEPIYREILLQSAKTLTSRFNPLVGCIRSWDHNSDKWDYPVIIDNMMNLELLFWAFRETKDSTYYNIAVTHANTTMKDHFRDNYSSFHVVSYDTLSGLAVKKNTHQGYADSSSWARGQAWGLYGYVMTYRETGDQRYLDLAENIAKYILYHPAIPEDMIPYWDYDAPGMPDAPRDASAAAITASALYELAGYSENMEETCIAAADQIIVSLSKAPYMLNNDTPVPFILDHSTGNYNNNSEVDVPIIYAEYYFIEALLRRKAISNKNDVLRIS